MTVEQATNTEGASKPKKPEVTYRMEATAIPKELRETVAEKAGPQTDLFPAKNGGGYKGKVIHADENYIVQTIGKEAKSAVAHKRSDVELQGASLLSRDANNDLVGRNIQVHYNEKDKPGKAYPWNAEQEASARQASADKKVSPSDRLMEAAKTYAAEHIPAKQREKFMQDIAGVAKLLYPEQAKTAEAGKDAAKTAEAGKQAGKSDAGKDASQPAKQPAKAAPQRARQDRQPAELER